MLEKNLDEASYKNLICALMPKATTATIEESFSFQ